MEVLPTTSNKIGLSRLLTPIPEVVETLDEMMGWPGTVTPSSAPVGLTPARTTLTWTRFLNFALFARSYTSGRPFFNDHGRRRSPSRTSRRNFASLRDVRGFQAIVTPLTRCFSRYIAKAHGYEVLKSVPQVSSVPPSEVGEPSVHHDSETMSNISWDAMTSDDLGVLSEEDWEDLGSTLTLDNELDRYLKLLRVARNDSNFPFTTPPRMTYAQVLGEKSGKNQK